MTETNIKCLPEGRTYFTEIGHSQQYPWVEIKRTEMTVTLAKVQVKPDPDFKPDFIPGGFCAHCSNQSEQTWLFDKISDVQTKTIRKTKRGWSHGETRFIENRAIEFYDWNF